MHETAKKLKRRGFLLLEGVLLLAVLSALSVGTTAIFSGQFNTMNAGKQASQAQQYASVEGTYVRIKGYPNVDDLTHDWKDMSDLVGTEDELLCRPAAGEGGDLVQKLRPAHEAMFPAVHLHGVAQGAGGAGDDGDLGHRGGVALEGGH